MQDSEKMFVNYQVRSKRKSVVTIDEKFERKDYHQFSEEDHQSLYKIGFHFLWVLYAHQKT